MEVIKGLFEELYKSGLFLDDVKVVKAYGKKGALNVYIDNEKIPVADEDVYFIDKMYKVAFISKVKNEVIKDMSELAKHFIFSKLTKKVKLRRLAEILGADEAALESFKKNLNLKSADEVINCAEKDGVKLNGANISFLILGVTIYRFSKATEEKLEKLKSALENLKNA